MAITFECEGCGKTYTVRDELGGKTGQCKQCGQQMIIPSEPDEKLYRLDEPEPAPEPATTAAPIPPRSFKPAPTSATAPGSPFDPPRPLEPKKGFFSLGGGRGGIGILILLVGMGVRVFNGWERNRVRNGGNRRPNAQGPRNPGPNANPLGGFAQNRRGPIILPNFPDPGPAREIEPGIMLREITLGPPRRPLGTLPGHGGRLWLYTPTGDHPAKSLPCVLITAAGSNLITGMDLAVDDRPEHLPYVRAGFAVLAFELDGMPQNRQNPSDDDLGQSMMRFLNARAGLVNAHIALEYALKMVPEIDPKRISAVGHSSAGTLALLFAEHDTRLKTCVAFAPATDLVKEFGPQAVVQLTRAGAGDLLVRYSPKENANKLNAPVLLFHAEDDSNVPVEETEAFARTLKAQGKPVTLDLVPTGEHYDSMIKEGIPHAIAWLNEQGAGPAP